MDQRHGSPGCRLRRAIDPFARHPQGHGTMILLIDNYDSFTFNLVHFLGELGAECDVRRNDALTAQEALALRPDAIVLSPGPCAPDAGGHLPGADRGGRRAGADPGRVPGPPGDRTGLRCHGGAGAGADARQGQPGGAPRQRRVRGPALPVRRHALPLAWWCARTACRTACRPPRTPRTAWSWGCATATRPVFGVQFHPESIASEHGHALLGNFLAIAGPPPASADAAQAPHVTERSGRCWPGWPPARRWTRPRPRPRSPPSWRARPRPRRSPAC